MYRHLIDTKKYIYIIFKEVKCDAAALLCAGDPGVVPPVAALPGLQPWGEGEAAGRGEGPHTHISILTEQVRGGARGLVAKELLNCQLQ